MGAEIGRGSHGRVFEALEIHSGRPCAIKVLNSMLATDEQFVYRLWREARSLEALWGTSVVEIYGFGQDVTGATYLAMELLEGQTLADRLADLEMFGDRMSAYDVLVCLEPIVRALHTAHGMNIIHRDLKPANIFLVEAHAGGGSRLMDFGLAKMEDELSLTQSGMVAGSPHYMAPEMLKGKPFDHRIDVYSVGAVAFRALAGRPMFPGEQITDVLTQVVRDPRPNLTEFRPDLPAEVDWWVQQALAIEPDARYSDCVSLWNGLLTAIQVGNTPSSHRARLLVTI